MKNPSPLLPGLALFALLPLLLAADCEGPVDDDDTTAQQSEWVVIDEGLPGALISIWGTSSTDVWVAGAHEPGEDEDDDDSGENRGPGIARHWDGSTWTDLEPPTDRDLWWVFSDGGDDVWYVGEDTIILRYHRPSSTWTELDSPIGPGTTLFGAWGPPGGPVFAVGGNVNSMDEGPVLLRIDAGVATEVTDPIFDQLSPMESFFKLWGTSEDDLWMISDHGSVFHWDGGDWSRLILPDNPRLVTINGGQADDIVIVGGESQAVVFEREGVAWNNVAPVGGSSLNGVFVDTSGNAWAAGMSNAVARRAEGGWVWVLPPLVLLDWHAVWLDETGTPWLAGGNLIDLIDGAVVRYDSSGG
jgi:hypothetical protein